MNNTPGIDIYDSLRYAAVMIMFTRMLSTVVYLCPNIGNNLKLKTRNNQKEKNQDDGKSGIDGRKMISSFKEMFYYQTSIVGINVGPIFNYQEFTSTMNPSKRHFNYFKILDAFVTNTIGDLIYEYAGSVDNVLSDNYFQNTTITETLIYITLISIAFRFRLNSAFSLGEIIMNACGVEVYNKNDPKCEKNKWINGMDFKNYLCKNSFRSAMRAWNMSIQLWIYRCFYKMLNLHKLNRNIALVIVIAFNMVWHGPYLAYFMAGSVFLFSTIIQDCIINMYSNSKNIKTEASNVKDLKECWNLIRKGNVNFDIVFNLILWITTQTTVDFIIVALFTTNVSIVWKLWKFLYFYPLIMWMLLLLFIKLVRSYK
ncbi:Membrane-bound O-acyltransferase domain-containing protein 2 [Intoshia linei]|uniref:Membrane-bound O-acyltransferase domain-containing protein 2 n=1 Tax=Intoshia linei TaxID=1819745 RepID=A0A177AZ94_9BILA|nr:Membrane-bound O-acyltransferase domain-containing protein 2 [Intoshia linei]